MATAVSLPFSKPTPSFLGIPLEIRREIYRYLLVVPWHIGLDGKMFFEHAVKDWSELTKYDPERSIAILRASKQISEEALDVFYSENFFGVALGSKRDRYICSAFPLSNRQRIRYLTIIAEDDDDDDEYSTSDIIRDPIGPPVFANLAKLCIVTALSPKVLFGRNKDDWIPWLKHVFEWINENARESLIIDLDDSRNKEVWETAEKCFTKVGFRRVQTKLGDSVFGRELFGFSFCDSEMGYDEAALEGYNAALEEFEEHIDFSDSEESTSALSTSFQWI